MTLDVILVMDGTPKSGKTGWAHEVKAANLFIDAFQGDGVVAKPNFAVIHYTGPRTWSGVSKCTGKSKKKVDQENQTNHQWSSVGTRLQALVTGIDDSYLRVCSG